MRVAKWVMRDTIVDGGNAAQVLCEEPVNINRTVVNEDEKVVFSVLRHQITGKLIGYELKYANDFVTKRNEFNYSLVFYRKDPVKNIDVVPFYADSVIRIVKYISPDDNIADYFFVGRWRSQNEALEEVEIDV